MGRKTMYAVHQENERNTFGSRRREQFEEEEQDQVRLEQEAMLAVIAQQRRDQDGKLHRDG